ncbi:MAG: glutamate 5-kinase [Deltaproteobacteria bacterium]|nr:glutamate 5-kinase [Deltaproteobacteria bacterium]
MRSRIKTARRVVVKLGSHVLSGPQGGFDVACVTSLAGEIVRARADGREVVIVSSGAILAGRQKLGLAADRSRALDVTAKQAIAAVGQVEIMRFWQHVFDWYGITVAQVLLTRDVVENRRRFLNACHTLSALIERGVVPIVNENDTVASEEIRLGDNDNLSAIVAGLADADLLVLLTDKEGVYTADPEVDAGATLVPAISVTQDENFRAGGSRSGMGLGGMETKVAAARIAAGFAIPTVIAHGKAPGILGRVLAGDDVGTFCEPRDVSLRGRKRWIYLRTAPAGTLIVDDGAKRAVVESGKSLLPGGIVRVDGAFDQGDPVDVRTESGLPFARGLVVYTSEEIDAIKGRKSAEIDGLLGYSLGEEVIHRDDLVLLGPDAAAAREAKG